MLDHCPACGKPISSLTSTCPFCLSHLNHEPDPQGSIEFSTRVNESDGPVGYVLRAAFSAVALLLTVVSCYLGLASNASLLGKAPNIQNYLAATVTVSWFLALPLLIGAACALFVDFRKLPWVALLLAGLGAAWDYKYGNSFLALLITPFNIVVSCWLALSCLSNTKRLLPLPVFIAYAGIALTLVIGYADFTDHQAERRAKAFCAAALIGQPAEALLASAWADSKNEKHVRWIQVRESLENGGGTVSISYRGANLLRIHSCAVVVSAGATVGGRYALE